MRVEGRRVSPTPKLVVTTHRLRTKSNVYLSRQDISLTFVVQINIPKRYIFGIFESTG